MVSRRLLQILTGLVGVATVGLGTVQVAYGVASPMYADGGLPSFPILDSNLRFFGGLGLGLGLLFLWIVPHIERHTVIFRVGWFCAFLGGLGRLLSLPAVGPPSTLFVVFTLLEVVGAPLFILWQARVAADPRWSTA